ncbi:MAG: peptidoglycan DD-metalloendopeptidase family protein [Lachnospiraceae bacterium]|nr:peptidoglycan DD-metalloendopeptidase family protein [Lachnospiraceae bacterium]
MDLLFVKVFNISIMASWLIIAVVLLRAVSGKLPKWVRGFLWLLVGIRLLMPFNIESPLSVLPWADTIVYEKEADNTSSNSPEQISAAVVFDENVMPALSDKPAGAFSAPKSRLFKDFNLLKVISVIWIFGVCFLACYGVVSYIRLKQSISDAVRFKENIFRTEKITSPFVLGIIKPRIYLPFGLSKEEEFMVLRHEEAHIKRKDHLVKPLGFILLSIYWFNPLIWVAFILMCRDIELACDEKVINEIGFHNKKTYSAVLLELSAPGRVIAACPVAFGEHIVSERIKNVLKMKRTGKILLALAIVICVVTGVVFLTNPPGNKAYADSGSEEQMTVAVSDNDEATVKTDISENESEAGVPSQDPAEVNETDNGSDENEENTAEPVVKNEDKEVAYLWPLPEEKRGLITSLYGYKEDVLGGTLFNRGVDIAGEPGTEILAVYDGVIEYEGYVGITDEEEQDIDADRVSRANGYVIILGLDDGNKAVYGTLEEDFPLKQGDRVTAGQVIGYLGNSGASTGPHLHFEMQIPEASGSGEAGMVNVDPLTYIQKP